MINLKTVIEIDMETETIYDIFDKLQGGIDVIEDEPVAIVTEDETYVIMTADDFRYIQNVANNPLKGILSDGILNELEILNINELETLISLLSSQLNLKMAKQYWMR